MSRPLRTEYENAWYHVMNRGINHRAIFLSDIHRQIFLDILAEVVSLFQIQIHSYCLMGNHYHLLIHTPFPNLGRAMRHLNGLYTQKFNRMENGDGPLFRGRYKAIAIEVDNYLLQVSRYIHLNPVEAKLCRYPEDYAWSSYQVYCGKKKSPEWLTTDFLLHQFGSDQQKMRYIKFVSAGNDSELYNFYNKNKLVAILGSDNFKKELLSFVNKSQMIAAKPDIKRLHCLPTIEEIMKIVALYFQIDIEKLHHTKPGIVNLPRLIGIYIARRVCILTYNEISKYFMRFKPAAVNSAICRLKSMMQKDKQLEIKISKLIEGVKSHFNSELSDF